jgi:paired amphipathic helix protein Sin3a
MLACSGRDAMCWEVLNDEWISHPQWAAEETGFSTHKKNLYEEALHRSEEERHEYDFHIEAITRTIQVLEPISARINMMDAEERATFKLKPGLGGQGKSIYQRIIKKVYGREHGLEVIAALHDSPAISVPVVLARLKQKEEEWKRAQREWNKVWREVDARNFYKSLDHQGTIFKGNDKKLVTPKQLVMDIENKVKEQARDRRDLVDPATYGRFIPKWQFSFKVEDWTTLQDCLKLVFSFLDRMGSSQMGRVEREKIESFLRPFMPLFFMINPTDFDAGLEAASSPVMGNDDLESEIGERDEVGSVMDDTEDGASVAGSSAGSRRGGRRGGASGGVPAVDLRKKLLKSAQEKGRKTRVNGKESAANSSRASPAPLSTDQMQVDTSEPNSPSPLITTFAPAITTDTATAPPPTWVKVDNSEGVGKVVEVDEEKRPKKGTFFCNNQFYVLLRLIQAS